jgi:RimJ/RimL family protein N-acetyltransferase
MDGNPASARVLERVGMRHEGTLRQRVEKWGARRDLGIWGMLRTERSGPT